VFIRLLSLGVPKARMKTCGWGFSKPKLPVTPTGSSGMTGCSLNRRVEFWILAGDKKMPEDLETSPIAKSVWEFEE
jgi:hypothetical protein